MHIENVLTLTIDINADNLFTVVYILEGLEPLTLLLPYPVAR